MQVRLGTASGLNTIHVTHWTYVEEVIEPPPVEEIPPPEADIALVPPEDDELLRDADVPPPSSEPPAPVAMEVEVPPPTVNKTLTLYVVGRPEPLIYEGAEAAALLGFYVSQSGSLL